MAALDIVERAIKTLGGSLSDVVRTRMMLQAAEDCDDVSEAHGWAFKRAGVRPSNTVVQSGLVGKQFLVEIEAEAVLGYEEVLRI